jgi:ribosomal protein RSM22 (predicted rRNA methylase)
MPDLRSFEPSRLYARALESWWLTEAAGRMKLRDPAAVLAQLEPLVSELSDSFTTERAAGFAAYARRPFAWLAYSLFYFPQTFMRVQWILQEAARRLQAAPSPDRLTPLRVLDLGSGTGAATAAWLATWPRSPNVAIDLTAVDASDGALDLMEGLIHGNRALFGDVDLTVRCADLRSEIRRLPGDWDVVLISYALNEAFHDASDHEIRSWWRLLTDRLAPGGLLIVCEPLVLGGTPLVVRLREWALTPDTGVQVVAPCLHQYDCPMSDGASGWCHDVRRWRVAESVQSLNRRLFRSVFDLKYSFLALIKQPVPTDDDAGTARLVAPVYPEKGRWSFRGCAADGCLRTYEVLQRTLDRQGQDAVDALERGDVVQFKNPVLLGDGLTYRAQLV